MFQNILVMFTWTILAYTVCTGNLSNSSKLISNKALRIWICFCLYLLLSVVFLIPDIPYVFALIKQ